MKRRDFFAVLGGGVVVMLVDDDVYAQETGGGRGGARASLPQELSAWLHIGETGIVTVYSGKVEVGQNARTSLTQAVAEELRAPRGVHPHGDGRYRAHALRYGHGGQPDHAANVAA